MSSSESRRASVGRSAGSFVGAARSLIESQFGQNVITGAVSLFMIGVLVWGLTEFVGIPVRIQISPRGWLFLLAALAALSWFTKKSGEVVIGFILISVPIVLFVLNFMPDFVIEVYASVLNPALELLGIQTTLQRLTDTSLGLLILVVTGTTIGIAASLRASGRAKKPAVIADRTAKTLSQYAETYLSIGRVIVIFGLGLLIVALNQLGELAAFLGVAYAQDPLLGSNILTGVGGYLSLCGPLPIIGTVQFLCNTGPVQFAVLAVILIAVGLAVDRETSGSFVQFIRRL